MARQSLGNRSREAIDAAGSMLRYMRLSVWNVTQWRLKVTGSRVICILRLRPMAPETIGRRWLKQLKGAPVCSTT
jgi:hypothetical protein